MAKIKNISGQDLEVPGLGRIVFAGQEVDVEDAEPYVCQESTWALVGADPSDDDDVDEVDDASDDEVDDEVDDEKEEED